MLLCRADESRICAFKQQAQLANPWVTINALGIGSSLPVAYCFACLVLAGLSDRATAARQRLLQHQQAQALSQAPSLSGLLFGSQAQQQSNGFGTQGTGADGDNEQRLPLAVRLKLPADGAADGSLLPVQLLRKYIAYAREHVHPVLSDEAKDILQVRCFCVIITMMLLLLLCGSGRA
jgi:hypothetical protein